jgi:hypothetical protein
MRLGLIESVKIHGCRRIEAVRNYVDRLRRDVVSHERLAEEQEVVCRR